jgi:hypothetical protein
MNYRIAHESGYGIAALSTLYNTWACTSIDPCDQNLKEGDASESSKTMADKVYCNLCSTNVDDRSKHCRICDKCVEVRQNTRERFRIS